MSALIKHINAINAATVEAAGPTDIFSILRSDLAYWEGMGITTPEQFDHHMAAEAYVNIHKDVHGIKPSWVDLDAMTTSEIENMIRSEFGDGDDRDVQVMMENGAPDEETARRWLRDVAA